MIFVLYMKKRVGLITALKKTNQMSKSIQQIKNVKKVANCV